MKHIIFSGSIGQSGSYNYKVETIRAGQSQAYGDSFYEYKVTANNELSEINLERFCRNFLYPGVRFGEDKGEKTVPHFADTEETFNIISKGVASYIVVSPYLD